MKILHIVPSFYPKIGGIETFSLSLVRSLQARGHENRVVASHSAAELPDSGQVDGVRIDRVPFLTALTDRDPKGILLSRIRVAQVKREFRPDIVHLHIGGPVAFLHLQTEDVAPAPLVITAYDLPEERLPSVVAVLAKAGRTAAISRIRLEECRRAAPDAAARMELIYCGLPDLPAFESCGKTETPSFLAAGRQVKIKGFSVAVEAFEEVHRAFPQARLVLAGDGPEHAALKRQVLAANLAGVVEMPGKISMEDLLRLYRTAWATLVPSLHSESFGLVALEAMQAGSAVIASRIGGLPEVVSEGETGLLVPVGDPQALASKMKMLCADPERAFALGRAGQARAETTFSWSACVDAYEKMYYEVV